LQSPPEPSAEKTSTGMDFEKMSLVYLDYAKRKFADDTYKYKLFVYSSFQAHLDNLYALKEEQGIIPNKCEIEPDTIIGYLNTIKSNNLYNVHRKELSALFNYMKRTYPKAGIINPCEAVDKMPYEPAPKRVPTEKEFLQIMLAADPTRDEHDLILVITLSLARVDEILRLKWPDVNFDTDVLTKWTKKRKGGAYQRIDVPMNADLQAVLWRRWQNRNQDEWVFYNAKEENRYMNRPKLMASICKRAGIKPIAMTTRKVPVWDKKLKKMVNVVQEAPLYYGFHSIRHFISSYLHNVKKVSTKSLMELLGHLTEKTTQIYVHSLPTNLREATASIEGDFTSNLVNPHSEAAQQKEKELTQNG